MQRFIAPGIIALLVGFLASGYLFVSRPYIASQMHHKYWGSPAETSYHQLRHETLVAQVAQTGGGRVYFIGHSQIEALDAAQVDERALNLGIGGDIIAHMIRRMADYGSLGDAGAVIFGIGINDLNDVTPQEMKKRAQAVIAMVPVNVPIVWSLALPADDQIWKSLRREKIVALNAAWKDLCSGRAKCVLSSAEHLLADKDGRLKPENHIGDGLHLSPQGYGIWRAVLTDDLRKAMSMK
jgi:lysophospholipase L1-like esterase